MGASGISEMVVSVCQMLVPVCQIISRRTPESYNFGTNTCYNFESLVGTEIMIIAQQDSNSALLN
jgi:putative N-acetylmannosamine-6-phosphate epimerase